MTSSELYSNKNIIATELDRFGLSKREREIAGLVMQGLSNHEIANRLYITEQTVKDQLHHAFEKMKIHRRTGLAAMVLRYAATILRFKFPTFVGFTAFPKILYISPVLKPHVLVFL